MARLATLSFIAVVFASSARAEPVSIRCADAYDKEPYFVTYDLQTNRFVLESRNLLKGEILVANDERLELNLNAIGGTILLFFDRKGNTMRWPGLPAEEFKRAPLSHACAAVTGRTMLSAYDIYDGPDGLASDRRQPIDAFSLRCPGGARPLFFTMDRSTKAVVLELESAMTMSGDIKSIAGPDISFTVGLGGKMLYDLVWHEQSRLLTGTVFPHDPTSPAISKECIVMKARSVMELYDRLTRWN